MNYIQMLQPIYPAGEARAIYRMVMELRFGLSMADVLMGKDRDLSPENQAELQNIMHRLSQGEPVQYVLGQAEFCGHTFRVRPGVLIPRPETAELVQAVCAAEPKGCAVLDAGTGSGCIAVSLALEGYRATGLDVSEEALHVARENALLHRCDVDFVCDNILQPSLPPERRWEVIVSNPPYICRSEAQAMHRNVLDHEPHGALFVPDEDPLCFYRALAALGRECLSPGGRMYLEINRRFGAEVGRLMAEWGYGDVRLQPDQFGNPRFILCTLAV